MTCERGTSEERVAVRVQQRSPIERRGRAGATGEEKNMWQAGLGRRERVCELVVWDPINKLTESTCVCVPELVRVRDLKYYCGVAYALGYVWVRRAACSVQRFEVWVGGGQTYQVLALLQWQTSGALFRWAKRGERSE